MSEHASEGVSSTMLGSVFARTIFEQRRALLWWAIGVVATVTMYSSFWPSIRDNAAQFETYLQSLPEGFRNLWGSASLSTPQGYIQVEFFSLLGPIILLVYAIGAGARAIAGEEQDGTMDLLLSTPVPRRRVVRDKFAAMMLGIALLTALSWLALAAMGPLFDMHLGLVGLTAATLNLLLLAAVFGAIALAAGAATGVRGTAVGVAGGIALATFVMNTLAPSANVLRPLRHVSPFHYYSSHQPLSNGFDVVDVAVLLGICVAACAVALAVFERRDIAA
jgi:ABC-2 type transport system permease protein